MCFKGSSASSIFFPLCFSFKFVTSILSSRNHLTQPVFYPANKGVYRHIVCIHIIYLNVITEYKHSFIYYTYIYIYPSPLQLESSICSLEERRRKKNAASRLLHTMKSLSHGQLQGTTMRTFCKDISAKKAQPDQRVAEKTKAWLKVRLFAKFLENS